MQKIYFLIFLLSFFKIGFTFSQCANVANIYSFSYNGNSYEIIKEQKTWVNAVSCAVERGGYLVEINDSSEQAAIWDAIVSGAAIPENYTVVSTGGGIAYVWIGATDQNNEGQWIWDGNNDGSGTLFWTGQGVAGSNNGSAVNGLYNHWGGASAGMQQEPDNYQNLQHYAAIGLSGWPAGTTLLGIPGEWNDLKGDVLLYFVVEKDGQTGFEKSNNCEIKLYPNPATETVYIQTSENPDRIEIMDMYGNRALFVNNSASYIDVSDLIPSVYFVKLVFDDQQTIIWRFIKN